MMQVLQGNPSPTVTDVDQRFWDYFNMETSITDAINVTEKTYVVPVPDQGFVIGIYSALLATGGVGNVAVFTALVRSRRRKSRVNLLMTHLAVADMFVTFIIIPLEIGWRTTNAWLAGNIACKVFLVLRAFGLYLSSNILVCISVDRFFAVLYPLRLPIARKRSKMMLYFAWISALACSVPQSLVFSVMTHPKDPDFQQCVSFDFFANHEQELAYNVFCLCAVYFFPLMIISVCYGCIFYEISKNSQQISDKCLGSDHSRIQLRRSDQRPLARARRRTLRMTVTIVTAFAACYLPYAMMTLWYMLDRQSAVHVSPKVQDFFFIMAVSNSCVNPLVYGTFSLDLKTFIGRFFRKVLRIQTKPSEPPGISAPGTVKSKLPTNEVVLPEMTKICTRPHVVRFEETSLAGPSASSDPMPCWSERSCEDYRMRASRSCEVFTIQTSKRTFHI